MILMAEQESNDLMKPFMAFHLSVYWVGLKNLLSLNILCIIPRKWAFKDSQNSKDNLWWWAIPVWVVDQIWMWQCNMWLSLWAWNSEWDNEALHAKSAINKLFSILIEVILVTQVCPEYQPINHKVYLKIAQIWQGAFKNTFPKCQTLFHLR